MKEKIESLHKNRKVNTKNKTLDIIYQQRFLIIMSLPFLVWLIIFKYIPLLGWTMAFQDYKPRSDIQFYEQAWVGLKHFKVLFKDPQFYRVMRNTLAMSLINLIIGFPIPIIFALLLNEIRHLKYKKVVQTVSYLPHFVSWVIVASLVSKTLSLEGIVNQILTGLSIVEKPILIMAQPKLFWWIVSFADIWKELGWNAILFLAAISSIDPNLYEAASIDGAGRWKKMWCITLPSIKPTIVVVFILCVGWMISIGFEKQFLLSNPTVQQYAEVLDLYVLNFGIGLGRYSYGTAIGVFKSVVSIILLFSANKVAKTLHGTSIM